MFRMRHWHVEKLDKITFSIFGHRSVSSFWPQQPVFETPPDPFFQKNVINTISTFRIKNNITNSSTAGKCIKTRPGDTESMSSQLAVHCTLYTHTRADKILQNAKKLHFHYSITWRLSSRDLYTVLWLASNWSRDLYTVLWFTNFCCEWNYIFVYLLEGAVELFSTFTSYEKGERMCRALHIGSGFTLLLERLLWDFENFIHCLVWPHQQSLQIW